MIDPVNEWHKDGDGKESEREQICNEIGGMSTTVFYPSATLARIGLTRDKALYFACAHCNSTALERRRSRVDPSRMAPFCGSCKRERPERAPHFKVPVQLLVEGVVVHGLLFDRAAGAFLGCSAAQFERAMERSDAGSYGGHAVATAVEQELEGLHCAVLLKLDRGAAAGAEHHQQQLQKDALVEELAPLEPVDLSPLHPG